MHPDRAQIFSKECAHDAVDARSEGRTAGQPGPDMIQGGLTVRPELGVLRGRLDRRGFLPILRTLLLLRAHPCRRAAIVHNRIPPCGGPGMGIER